MPRRDSLGPQSTHIREAGVPPRSEAIASRIGASLLLMYGALAAGCGCDEDKPYTPFQVASSLPNDGSGPPENAPRADEDSSAKAATKVLRVGGGSATAKLFGRELKAPAGTWLEVALYGLNGEPDLVYAWVLPQERGSSIESAGVWSFDLQGNPLERVFPLPGFLPNGKDCQFIAELEPSGAHTFTSQIQSHCSSEVLAGTPVRSIAVLDPKKDDPEIIHLRHSAPPPGEKITLTVNSKDRDGDGTDDVEVTILLKGPSGIEESMPLRWLVRTAGASREPEAPRGELEKRASRLLIASVRKAERGKAPEEIDTLRRLLSAVCSELGSPLVRRASGDKLSCGDLVVTLGRLAESEVKSYLGEENVGRALGAVERATWFGKGIKRPDSLVQLLEGKIPFEQARIEARFRVEAETSASPFRTPLVFDEKGQLWLRGKDKIKRLTMKGDPPLVVPETEDEPEKRVEPPEWSIDASGPDGQKPKAAFPSCERSEVLLVFEDGPGRLGAPIPLPILSPRPGKCGGFAPEPLAVTPLYWENGALLFALAGETLTSRAQAKLPARPTAWETSMGLAVGSKDKLRLWTGAATSGLHHCAVSTEKNRVACLGNDHVAVLTTTPPNSEGGD